MHRIHFDNRSLTICSSNEHSLLDPNALIVSSQIESEIAHLPEFFSNAKHIAKLYFVTDDQDKVFNTICQQFKEIDAGGGVVTNHAGDYLLIYRSEKWDLPKGMREDGEEMAQCALREVTEETGIEHLILNEKICITHHTFYRNNQFCIKHTHWYKMTLNDANRTTPQKEEDIEKAAWVAKSALPEYLLGTYPSITEVFKKAKVL